MSPTAAPERKKYKLADLADKAVKASLKRPQTGAEIATRMKTGHDGRGIGRALALAVKDGRLEKHATRVPTYSKVG